MAKKHNKSGALKNKPLSNIKTNTAKSITYSEQFSGPLPSPKALEHYNSIITGGADRIIAMTEKQQNHRMELEKINMASGISHARTGLHYGLIVAIAGIAGTVALGIWGNPWTSGLLGGSTLSTLCGSFLYGTYSRRSERLQKFNDTK